GIVGDGRRQDLHRNGPAEARVARAIDLAKAARPQRAEHFVMRDGVGHHFFGGLAGRISTRLGRLRLSVRTRSSTTWATSSGRSFQSLFGSACPAKSVFTEPGQT